MRHRIALALLLAGLFASWVGAQVPAGAEFQVNTYTTARQTVPALASDAAGNFVVAWSSLNQDGSGDGIFGQRYDAAGQARGAEFQVNTYTTNPQRDPSVASDAAGNFVVAWQSNQDGSDYGVFAQRYDASGARRGAEFQVNSYTTHWQHLPSLASDAAGNFVVAWKSYGQDGDRWGIFGQRYDASGARRGSEFQVNTWTTEEQYWFSVASDAAGNFVVAWTSFGQDGSSWGVFAQRYDASGARRGAEFRVNTYTPSHQLSPAVASDAAGNFVVAWESYGQDGSDWGVFGQRYDASGARRGAEFQVNTWTTDGQDDASVASDAAGNLVVAWRSQGQDGSSDGVFAQRYDAPGARRGAEFPVNTYTTDQQYQPSVASDAAGNLLVAWTSLNQDGSDFGVFAQRWGGLVPAALAVDPSASAGSDGNGLLEPGETAVVVTPSWQNVNGSAQTFDGVGAGFSGPATSGVSYSLPDGAALYGTVADGTTAACSDCYEVGVTFGGTRPATHWDATFTERLTPDTLGQTKPWLLHVGESFTDVPTTSGYYRFVETLLHKGVAGGCTATTYCPGTSATRGQMAIFALVGKEGSSYSPPACGTTPMFADVPVTSPFCRWVEELARRGVVSGCGGGNYCPSSAVNRAQMAVFISATFGLTLYGP